MTCKEGRNTNTVTNSSITGSSQGAQLMPYSLSLPFLKNLQERKQRKESKSSVLSNRYNAGNPFEDEQDEEQEDDEDDDNRHTDLSSDSENENQNQNGNVKGNFLLESSTSSNKSNAYVIPISLAITDFHFLVLAKILFLRKNRKECKKREGRGIYEDRDDNEYTGVIDSDHKNKGSERGREPNLHLLAFSRLDGTLSQSIELRTQIPKKKCQVSHGIQQQQHRTVTDSRKKNSSENSSTLSSSSSVDNDNHEEETDGSIYYLEGVPLSVLSDQKMGSVWLNTDRGLYQVDYGIFYPCYSSNSLSSLSTRYLCAYQSLSLCQCFSIYTFLTFFPASFILTCQLPSLFPTLLNCQRPFHHFISFLTLKFVVNNFYFELRW